MLIKDVIHRFATVPELCKKFIDTPEFNRLRRIKQLGLAYYVYPSATHTRFEHSIGVMTVTGKICDRIGISGRPKELVQLAALIHDSGHVAFSHLFDYILIEKKIDSPLIHHEQRSICILKEINARLNLLTDEEVETVSKMILGDNSDTKEPYLYEIVSGVFGLDSDRLDYLQRDSYHTGLPCFQGDYIIECLGVKDGHLALRRKGREELELLFMTRKRLFTIVYRHKTVLKIEKIVREAIDRLDISKEWFEKNWLKLDDGKMYCLLQDVAADLIEKIETRDWSGIEEEDESERFNHVTCITKEDIESQMKKVVWF